MSLETSLLLYRNPKRLWFALVASIAFVAACVWIFFGIADTQTRMDPMLARLFAVVGAIFFGISAVFSSLKFFDHKPILEISPNGLLNRSTVGHGRLILWDEVNGIRRDGHFILVDIKDPEAYVNATSSILFRSLHRKNWKMVGTPICIAHRFFTIPAPDLEEKIKEVWYESKDDGKG